MEKSQSGFTLVEVIFTAVLVAVLAAVAIPIYTSYVTAQKQTNVQNLATTGAGAANAYYRRKGTDPTPTQLNLFLSSPADYTVTVSGGKVTVTYVPNTSITASVSYK